MGIRSGRGGAEISLTDELKDNTQNNAAYFARFRWTAALSSKLHA
jgi:hypothetical protein